MYLNTRFSKHLFKMEVFQLLETTACMAESFLVLSF